MSNDVEVHIDFEAGLKRIGTLHRHSRRGAEAPGFEYHVDWLSDTRRRKGGRNHAISIARPIWL